MGDLPAGLSKGEVRCSHCTHVWSPLIVKRLEQRERDLIAAGDALVEAAWYCAATGVHVRGRLQERSDAWHRTAHGA